MWSAECMCDFGLRGCPIFSSWYLLLPFFLLFSVIHRTLISAAKNCVGNIANRLLMLYYYDFCSVICFSSCILNTFFPSSSLMYPQSIIIALILSSLNVSIYYLFLIFPLHTSKELAGAPKNFLITILFQGPYFNSFNIGSNSIKPKVSFSCDF